MLLFRYSALTFNGHRIHYDRRYVTEVEGYPGLIVHGPLIATLLLDLLRREHPDATLRRFEFKARAARCSTCTVHASAAAPTATQRVALWARDARRRAGDAGDGRARLTPARENAMLKTAPDRYQDIRDAVRALCAAVPRRVLPQDRRASAPIPRAFVDALTKAGWLAALIPQEYGGSGLGLAEASVIMEEINRCGGNSGACHGQMYNMGTLLRHGSRRAEAALPAEDRDAASCACSRWA